MSHQPHTTRPGHGSMAFPHPAMPRQQTLEDIPHDHDYGDPQACAHQDSSNYSLAVCGHISTVDREKGGQKG